MTNSVLLIDSDLSDAAKLAAFLTRHNFTVEVETHSDYALSRILLDQPNCVILNASAVGVDGLSLCRQARSGYSGVVILLGEFNDPIEEVAGLEMGADDYLSKPVRARVLLARLRALLRRAERDGRFPVQDWEGSTLLGENQPGPEVIELRTLRIDVAARAVQVKGQEVRLTDAEFDLLRFLAVNAGRVVSRSAIQNELRGFDFDGLDRAIDLRVSRIRRKLGDNPRLPSIIKSVRGVGYLLPKETA
ncbi:MAG: winged helix-turn-helix domain-containing protein [Burkholderiaceae bacterium]